jgi:hypothetical protein
MEERDRDAPAVVVKADPTPVGQNGKSDRKKWKIEIIAGKEHRIDEVDLQEELPSTPTAAKGS